MTPTTPHGGEPRARTVVVTGAASGIGRATTELLRERAVTVIGVDLHDADIEADLTTTAGRAWLASEANRLSGGHIDGIAAVAGLLAPTPATIAVNYFGVIRALEALHPLLALSDAPRAVVVTSVAGLQATNAPLVDLLLADDEPAALAWTAQLAEDEVQKYRIYASSKAALSRWIRRMAPTPHWAGAGIALNAVAPGVVLTPMIAARLSTEEGREATAAHVPMPLNGNAEPIVIARLIAWLLSEENTHLCGQVIFADGGADAVTRGDTTW